MNQLAFIIFSLFSVPALAANCPDLNGTYNCKLTENGKTEKYLVVVEQTNDEVTFTDASGKITYPLHEPLSMQIDVVPHIVLPMTYVVTCPSDKELKINGKGTPKSLSSQIGRRGQSYAMAIHIVKNGPAFKMKTTVSDGAGNSDAECTLKTAKK